MATRTSSEIETDIVRRYIAGESSVVIKRSLGVPTSTVLRILKRAGLDPASVTKSRPRQKQKIMSETHASIISAYEAGASLSQIAAAHKVVLQTVRGVLLRNGVQRRPRGGAFTKVSPAQVEEMGRRWAAGVSQAKIGRDFGLTQANVSKLLLRAGITVERRQARRETHGSWKGGIVGHASGYLMVRIEHDDPLHSMANSGGYAMEHRYVLARALGRALWPWETVHHIDGNSRNNDLVNLQLRIGKHGKHVAYECACCGSRSLRPVDLA